MITSAGGNGFVETSSKVNLQAYGSVSAPSGEWLLDPTDFTIDDGGTTVDSVADGTFTPSGDTASIDRDDIVSALSGGTSVTINTTSGGSGNGDITLSSAIAPNMASGTATLTFNAERHFSQNGNFDAIQHSNGTLNVVINADSDGNNVGDVTLNSFVNTAGGGGGTVTISGQNLTSQNLGQILTANSAIDLNMNGTVTLNLSLIHI